jgi:FdhD protein
VTPDPLSLKRLGYAKPLLEVAARQWQDGGFSDKSEQVIEETPVALVYNGQPHVVMMATPQDLEDFAVGFSVTEELVHSAKDVQKISVVNYSAGIELQLTVPAECDKRIAERARKLAGQTGCGICGADSIETVLKTLHPVTAKTTVKASAVQRAIKDLEGHQKLNAATGSTHAAAWASHDGALRLVREDVGRHNALDKLIGALLKSDTEIDVGFVLVTSRASFEMVQKVTVLGAPLLAAISGPTGLAVRIAEQAGLTLVGFARPGRMTVFAHPERVTA